jgi:hypothetical protein
LYWLYQGGYKGCGRPKKYAGKVDIVSEKARFSYHLTLEDGVDRTIDMNYGPHHLWRSSTFCRYLFFKSYPGYYFLPGMAPDAMLAAITGLQAASMT